MLGCLSSLNNFAFLNKNLCYDFYLNGKNTSNKELCCSFSFNPLNKIFFATYIFPSSAASTKVAVPFKSNYHEND